ncbi:hypothetical protein HanRHA438_Chr12g0535741 [Helianthus annuus]|nr:hypothetical protein HanRHA438_Chr12g0535741 [Helianthus annuus]
MRLLTDHSVAESSTFCSETVILVVFVLFCFFMIILCSYILGNLHENNNEKHIFVKVKCCPEVPHTTRYKVEPYIKIVLGLSILFKVEFSFYLINKQTSLTLRCCLYLQT